MIRVKAACGKSVMFQLFCLSILLFLNPVHVESSQLYSCQEQPNITLYYTDYCPYSQKVLYYLHKIHKKVPMKNVGKYPQYREELLKAGGKLQVPCLTVDGKAIYESDTIIKWLSEHQDCLEPS